MSSKSNSKSAGGAAAGPGSDSRPVNLKSGVWDHFFARQCKADRAVQIMQGKSKNGRRVNKKSSHGSLNRLTMAANAYSPAYKMMRTVKDGFLVPPGMQHRYINSNS
jgi:hypothetical protein